MAKEIVQTHLTSKGNYKVDVEARGFQFRLDEPEELNGENTGMNPVEALLGSLGACKMIVARMLAESENIKLEDIKITMKGEIDLDRLKGLNPEAKLGFSEITTEYDIKANNTAEEIDAFIQLIDQTCPVYDTIKHAPEMRSKRI